MLFLTFKVHYELSLPISIYSIRTASFTVHSVSTVVASNESKDYGVVVRKTLEVLDSGSIASISQRCCL